MAQRHLASMWRHVVFARVLRQSEWSSSSTRRYPLCGLFFSFVAFIFYLYLHVVGRRRATYRASMQYLSGSRGKLKASQRTARTSKARLTRRRVDGTAGLSVMPCRLCACCGTHSTRHNSSRSGQPSGNDIPEGWPGWATDISRNLPFGPPLIRDLARSPET